MEPTNKASRTRRQRFAGALLAVERFIIYRILHVDDTPHRLALGLALGIFLAWTPAVGVQMFFAMTIAALIGANGRVAIPLVWISNPLTFGVIYYPNYLVGNWLVRIFRPGTELSYDELQLSLQRLQEQARHFYQSEFWRALADLLTRIGVELWIGSLVVGLFLGAIVYVSSLRFIIWYRRYRKHPPMHDVELATKTRQTA